jgi:hypothetical protein
MDTLLIICTSLLLTSTNHFLPKLFLYEYDETQPPILRPLVFDEAVRPAG